jgi:hypothetical protein
LSSCGWRWMKPGVFQKPKYLSTFK